MGGLGGLLGGLKIVRKQALSARGGETPAQRRRRRSVLFLCIANSARSQMAEGFARHLAPRGVRVTSAGSRPGGLNALAVEVMAEVGIDISAHAAKSMDTISLDEIGVVIFLCADEICPVFPARVERIHWPLPDPAAEKGSRDKRLRAFRRVRTELHQRIGALMELV